MARSGGGDGDRAMVTFLLLTLGLAGSDLESAGADVEDDFASTAPAGAVLDELIAPRLAAAPGCTVAAAGPGVHDTAAPTAGGAAPLLSAACGGIGSEAAGAGIATCFGDGTTWIPHMSLQHRPTRNMNTLVRARVMIYHLSCCRSLPSALFHSQRVVHHLEIAHEVVLGRCVQQPHKRLALRDRVGHAGKLVGPGLHAPPQCCE